jgi:hypothetical protein
LGAFTKKVTIVICGEDALAQARSGKPDHKIQQALKRIDEGFKVEIISEERFLELLKYSIHFLRSNFPDVLS